MRKPRRQHTRGFLVAALVAVGLAFTGTTASAATVTIDLCATSGPLTPTGAVTVPIWGFGLGDCTTATAGLPGPVLTVEQGDVVTLNVTNHLPGTRTLHVEIPGINVDPASEEEAGFDETATVTFTADAPGTYLYQSSGDSGRQTAMGLYGALIVRPLGEPLQAYGPDSAFEKEAVLVLSALDPAFNADPDNADLNDYLATYWMINGHSYPDTPGIQANPGELLLLRYLNAGFDQTTMTLLGTHEHVIARDAHVVPSPFDAVAETIPAGATEDAIVTMPGTSPPASAGFALYNRQLHLTNGPQTGTSPTPITLGGMMTFIHP